MLSTIIIILADPNKSYLVNNLTTWNQSNRKWNKCERNNVGFFGINKPQRFATQDVTAILFRLGLTSSIDTFRYNIGFSKQLNSSSCPFETLNRLCASIYHVVRGGEGGSLNDHEWTWGMGRVYEMTTWSGGQEFLSHIFCVRSENVCMSSPIVRLHDKFLE